MVHNPGYSSIEDAWGTLNPMLQPKKKKKKTKDVVCDLYELGQRNGNYDELDMVRAANYDKSRFQRDRAASRESAKHVNIDTSDMRPLQNDLAPIYDKGSLLENDFMSTAYESQCSSRTTPLPEFKSHFSNEYDSFFRPLTTSPEEDADEQPADPEYQEFKDILNKRFPAPSPAPREPEIVSAGGYEKPGNKMYFEEEFYEPLSKPSAASGFLDVILYIISGVILIFMMEQFVKIGKMLQ
jgi:hypothetical protein